MNAVFLKTWPLLVAFCIGVLANLSSAGTCWSTMLRKHNGICTELLYTKMSREDCCSRTSISTAWSPEDFDPASLIFWRLLRGGAKCFPCKESCAKVKCEAGRTCVLRKGVPKCVCSSVCKEGKKRPKQSVCGTDGQTYKNWCKLRKKACNQKLKNLSVAYYGACQSSCDKVKCPEGKTCLLDQNLTPHCIKCSKKRCPPVVSKHRQVCGSDGITYKSACHLRDVACYAGKAIPIAYKGSCKANATCHDIHCQNRQQCLVDLEAGGRPRCVTCSAGCNSKYAYGPVCGTNNSTYQTWCHMMQDACAKGYVIDTQHSGKCLVNRKESWQ